MMKSFIGFVVAFVAFYLDARVAQAIPIQSSIAVRSNTYLQMSSAANTFTATEPSGATTNDILFMFIDMNHTTGFTGPTGWTLLYNVSDSNLDVYLYWIRRSSSAPSYTASWTGATSFADVSVTAFSGVVTSGNPIDVSASPGMVTANPWEPDSPSVTTTVANDAVVSFGMTWAGWGAEGPILPSGYAAAEGSAQDQDLAVAFKIKTTAGAEDPPAFQNIDTGGNEQVGFTVALMSAGTPPTAATLVQGCNNKTAASSVTCAMGANVTAGNLLVMRSKMDSTTTATPTVTTSSGVTLTWNLISTTALTCFGFSCSGPAFMSETMYYAVVPSTGAQTVQVSWSSTGTYGSFVDITIAEYHAPAGFPSSPLDRSNSGTSGSTFSPTSTCSAGSTGTLSQATELVIVGCSTWTVAHTWAAGPGFTERTASETNTVGWFDILTTTTTAVSYTMPIGEDEWMAHIATFKMNPTKKIRHRVSQLSTP